MSLSGTVIGLDLSTQSLSAVIIHEESGERITSAKVDYRSDSRLRHFNLHPDTAVTYGTEGEANQPPEMFLTALDCIFQDIRDSGFEYGSVRAINCSAQQHGHVYLAEESQKAYKTLHTNSTTPLAQIFSGAFSYPHAPIWMTSNSQKQAQCICNEIGGTDAMVARSGSASPPRFTGAIILRVAQQNPAEYHNTYRIHLLSSWVSSLLCGDIDTAVDYGNGSGTSLLNWQQKNWDQELLAIVSKHGATDINNKLPLVCSPLDIVGTIAPYFCARYGFNHTCNIVAGSGDNPQSKVLVSGDLLSLGSSFVIMAEAVHNRNSLTNAMYDGVGRPFLFGCRTNGALVWDALRAKGAISLELSEKLLSESLFINGYYIWQPQSESFPPSPAGEYAQNSNDTAYQRYTKAVESALALTAYYSAPFVAPNIDAPLAITGGASLSPSILRRCAALWQRPVCAIVDRGAATGAAVAASVALAKSKGAESEARYQALCNHLMPPEKRSILYPTPEEQSAATRYMDSLINYVKEVQ